MHNEGDMRSKINVSIYILRQDISLLSFNANDMYSERQIRWRISQITITFPSIPTFTQKEISEETEMSGRSAKRLLLIQICLI